MIDVVYVVSHLLWALWALAGTAIFPNGRANHFVKTAFFELKPFALPLLALVCLTDVLTGDLPVPMQVLLAAWNFLSWLVLRTIRDDDDRWKRRRRKVAERIQRQGARLVAVAEAAS